MSSDYGLAGLSEAEFELLADYTFGALEAAEGQRVASLIRRDPRWYEAHTALLAAGDLVTADLRSAPSPAMPADVAARLDAALSPGGPSRSPLDVPPSNVVAFPLQRARRRRIAMLVTGVAAAAVLAVGIPVALDLVHRAGPLTVNGASGDSAGSAPQRGPGLSLGGAPVVLRSGTDYQPTTLAQLGRLQQSAPNPPAAATRAPSPVAGSNQSSDQAKSVPRALADLVDAGQLQACLGAIAQAHPGTPLVVDYAYFRGSPALLVLVSQDGRESVVVVGPSCGKAGADEQYFAPIG